MTATLDKKPTRFERVAALGYEPRPTIRLAACPLCKGTDLEELHDVDRFGFSARSEFCGSCGFVFLNPRMAAEGYAEFYAHWYRPLVQAATGMDFSAPEIQAQHAYVAQMTCDAVAGLASHPARRTALDIGGSNGHFAKQLRDRFGYEVTVLDPSPAELAESSALGFETIQGLAEEFEFAEPRTFDVVSMVQTVDHLLDPVAVFHKAHHWLSDFGVFVVDFVDFAYQAERQGLSDAIKTDHPLYFTRDTARLLMLSTGFEPVSEFRAEKHLLYACRKMPALKRLPRAESVAAFRDKLAEWKR